VDLLRDVAQQHPAADAFVTATGGRLSYAEWDRAADGIASGLADRGVTAGDVVCLLMPSSPEYMVCYQAVMRLGAVTSGINQRLGPEEVAHILDRARPRVTVVGDGGAWASTPAAGTVLPWDELKSWWGMDAPALPSLIAGQPVLICWTGGTTGRPRGAVFDHENLRAVAGATGVLSARSTGACRPSPFPTWGR